MEEVNKVPLQVASGKEKRIQSEVFKRLWNNTQLMLLCSNIGALCSYILLIITVARLYACFEGTQRMLMVTSLGTMYLLFAMLLWFAWKGSVYKKASRKEMSVGSHNGHLDRLATLHKKRVYCLIAYAILLAMAGTVFFIDIHNGFSLILKVSVPAGVVAFLAGIYFMIKFKDQAVILQSYKAGAGFSEAEHSIFTG